MTGPYMLTRARDLAHHFEKIRRPGATTVLHDLINEVERLREAAKGSAVIVNQAGADMIRWAS